MFGRTQYVRLRRGARVTDLFLSYKAEDRARVAPLVQALETDGLSVWWDAHIGGGDQWRETILRHLEAAKCVIVVWSRRSVGPRGEFVRDEASRAQRRETYFPIRIDKVDPPLGFGETQALDLSGWKGDRSDPRYRALVEGLHKRFGIKVKRAKAAPAEGRGLDRRSIVIGGGAAAVAAAGAGAWFLTKADAARSNSIAVLPFANLSGDPAQAYFSDGIAEELRSTLSRIPGLQVVARTSSEAVRNDDAKTAAAKLDVTNILTGSVRRSPQMIRVSAQLVDGRKGLERWSQDYDQPVGDALQIQSDIALQVAQALSIHLGRGVQHDLSEGGTRNAAAQDRLLKARGLRARDDSHAASRRALEYIDSALAFDPRYADALAVKSAIVTVLADDAATPAEKRRLLNSAQQTAGQAIAIAPRSARARSALAAASYFDFKFREALRQFAIMESLLGESGGETDYLAPYAFVLYDVGNSAHGLEIAARMVAADPLNPGAYHAKAQVLFGLGRFEEAAAADSQAIALAPELAWPRAWRARALMKMDRLDEAKAEFAKLHSRIGIWTAWEAILEERRGNRAESNRLLDWIRQSESETMHYQFAEILAQQGRTDDAIAELEKAWTARDSGLTSIKTDELLVPLHSDPRYQAIVRRMNFPA
jgi:serine/threonine-protein kinase